MESPGFKKTTMINNIIKLYKKPFSDILKQYYLYIPIIFIVSLLDCWGQDPQFSQYYSSPLYLSPSFAGSTEGSRIVMNYRDQWPKLRGSFTTYALSFDHYFNKYKSGVGLLFFRDEAGGGLYNSTNIGMQYSYDFNINKYWHIRPGVHFFYYQKKVDFKSLFFADQVTSLNVISPTSVESPRSELLGHFDFTSAVLVYSKNFWVGVTVDHLMSLNKTLAENDDYLPIRFSVYSGAKYMITGRTILRKEESISFTFRYLSQSYNNILDVGTYYIKAPLTFGLWYKGLPVFKRSPNNGAFTFLVGYKIKDLSLAYSYDFTISQLITITGGANEVSLIFNFSASSLLVIGITFILHLFIYPNIFITPYFI